MQQRSGQSTLDWHTQANGFLHCQERKILLSACYYEISDSDNAEGAGKSWRIVMGGNCRRRKRFTYDTDSMAIVERERTSAELVMYALYLYFLGLSFRNTSRALEPFVESVAVWQLVQRFDPKQVYPCKRITAFLIDEGSYK